MYSTIMSSAVSVAAVAAPSRSGATSWVAQTARASVTQTAASSVAQPVEARNNVPQTVSVKAAPSPASGSVDPRLPLGLLLSTASPPSGNVMASSDYSDMETALRSDNLAAAQQAYLRLQSDLQLREAGASGANHLAAKESGQALDVVA